MTAQAALRLGTLRNVAQFQEHLELQHPTIPCDAEVTSGPDSPLRTSIHRGGIQIGNRIAIQPMEGWDGTANGNPTESTVRRWRRFGRSGAKLIWGGEAVAVAERDRLWELGDPAYYELVDAVRHLGNVAFRDPIPAYKHSAAVFLHLTGRIPTDLPHPQNPKRPPWEAEILEECMRRLCSFSQLKGQNV